VKEVLYAAHAATGLSPKPNRLTTERMIAALWGMSWHKVKPTPAPIVVMRAATDPSTTDLQRWSPHTGGGLTVVDVPGGHNSMLTPPYVDALAGSIAEQLAKVEQGTLTAADA
jgi:thioesterase domain-containing protein